MAGQKDTSKNSRRNSSMTVEASPVVQDQNARSVRDDFRVKIPIGVSIPCAESKSGLLKSYTSYCMKVRFFSHSCDSIFTGKRFWSSSGDPAPI